MEEHLPQKIANSILECLPEGVRTESYVDSDRQGRYSLLLRKDGEGQVHLMRVWNNLELILYGKDRQHELECTIKMGVERIGYMIKWGPTDLGSSFLYLLEHNGIETR